MSKMQKTISPIDGEVIVERTQASAEVVKELVVKASAAQKQWRRKSLEDRQELCHQAIQNLGLNKEQLAKELCWQMGRPIRYATGEVESCIDRALHMISISEESLQTIQAKPKDNFDRYIVKEAVGVVLVIAPWNYPLHTPINAIIPALLAGNTVILKHSSQTPLCAERLVEAFNLAGLPTGVLQFVHTSHENIEAMIQLPQINAVSFTGSVPAGKTIEKAAAGRFINMGLELGGKDPCYIREDADIKMAIENTVDGAFFNSGQSCCGIERIYVHESVYDEYIAGFVDLVEQYQLGRSDDFATTLGPLVRPSAAEFVRGQISEAIEQGAKSHINPNDFQLNKTGSAYMAPQVLTDVNHTMRIMTEESFGPVVGVMKVSSDEEAIKLMNDSEFGLSASIFSSNIEEAVELGKEVETGTFFVNRCDYLDPELAWTGIKNTGRGCTLSTLGFDNFTQAKSFHIKHHF